VDIQGANFTGSFALRTLRKLVRFSIEAQRGDGAEVKRGATTDYEKDKKRSQDPKCANYDGVVDLMREPLDRPASGGLPT
jgi:hypothetical protein